MQDDKLIIYRQNDVTLPMALWYIDCEWPNLLWQYESYCDCNIGIQINILTMSE